MSLQSKKPNVQELQNRMSTSSENKRSNQARIDREIEDRLRSLGYL